MFILGGTIQGVEKLYSFWRVWTQEFSDVTKVQKRNKLPESLKIIFELVFFCLFEASAASIDFIISAISQLYRVPVVDL